MARSKLDDTRLPLEGLRVLVVEDNVLTAYLVEMALIENGATLVATCRTAAEAARLMTTEQIDFALVDLRLADRFADDVFELAIQCGIRFAVMTGLLAFTGTIPDQAAGLLQKPVSARALVEIISEKA
jgi:DNA-binding NtrC family response regulator